MCEDPKMYKHYCNIITLPRVYFLYIATHVYLETFFFVKCMLHSNKLQNIMTIYNKYLTYTHKNSITISIFISSQYTKFLVCIWSKYSFGMNYSINRYMNNDIVRIRFIVSIILEGIMIWQFLCIGMNINWVCTV